MQVQSISNNNHYNNTFGVSRKFNKKEYENLKSLRRSMISRLASDKFDPEKCLNVAFDFVVKFIECPQERKSLRPMDAYLREYFSNREFGLKQMFNMWKNNRKVKKMMRSMSSEEIEKTKESLTNTFKKHNIEQSQVERGKIELAKFLGYSLP